MNWYVASLMKTKQCKPHRLIGVIGRKSATKETVGLADKLLEIIKGTKEIDESLELNYNKALYWFIAAKWQGVQFCCKFKPNKKRINLDVKFSKNDEFDAKIESADLETLALQL